MNESRKLDRRKIREIYSYVPALSTARSRILIRRIGADYAIVFILASNSINLDRVKKKPTTIQIDPTVEIKPVFQDPPAAVSDKRDLSRVIVAVNYHQRRSRQRAAARV